MRVKCIENRSNNTNFTHGKEYKVSPNGIRCDWHMYCYFENWDRPHVFNIGKIFSFAMCKFEIVG